MESFLNDFNDRDKSDQYNFHPLRIIKMTKNFPEMYETSPNQLVRNFPHKHSPISGKLVEEPLLFPFAARGFYYPLCGNVNNGLEIDSDRSRRAFKEHFRKLHKISLV